MRLSPALSSRISRVGATPALRNDGRTILTGLAVTGVTAAFIYNFYSSSTRPFKMAATDVKTQPKKIFPGGPAFTRLTLEESEQVTPNTKRLRFALPSKDAISGMPLTSALLTFSWPSGALTPVLRPYTPVSPSDAPGYIEFLVKKYPMGKQSSHLHALKAGDSLLFMVAVPGYKWTPNKHDSVTLIAGGAGITPVYQLIQGIFDDPANDKTKVTAIIGVNANEEILLQKELQEYEKKFPGRFRAVWTVSHPIPTSPHRTGYVTKELIKEETAGGPEDANTKVLVCGPPAMEEALIGKKGWFGSSGGGGILAELGYSKDQIYQF